MSTLMRECDMSIATASSTLYELCACCVAAVTYVLADNQIQCAQILASRELMLNAGDFRTEGFVPQLEECVQKMFIDSDLRASIMKRVRWLVDGKGTERLADFLIDND